MEPTDTSRTHIAGLDVTLENRYVIQRCAVCGEVLINVDLNQVATISSTGLTRSSGIATWQVGGLVRVDGVNPKHFSLLDGTMLPSDACANSVFGEDEKPKEEQTDVARNLGSKTQTH